MNSNNNESATIHRGTLAWIVLLTLAHCFVWFVQYNQTALGESPALDNRQTLLLAEQMARGEFSSEPFHRAPLYPYLLSLFLSCGLPADLLPLIARLLNALALATIAGTTASMASRIWQHRAAPWIAGLSIGLNPVLLFFSGDAFDILLATAAFSLAISQLADWLPKPTLKRSLSIGITLTIGAALRSHLLPLALLWPIAACIFSAKNSLRHLSVAALAPLLSFILLGLANQQVAGVFRMMPWQGAYSLWAGNKPNANGRIYAQVIRVEFENQYDNPAKLESIALYQDETGELPPHDISKMNSHWQSKALTHMSEHPVEWIGLMLRKAYYFLNTYEQYDNKTYGFHKAQHLQLRLNPLHWGALLLLAVAGILIGLNDTHQKRFFIALMVIFAIYAAGTILFYTSNRFRLPILPVLALLSAGCLRLPTTWQRATKLWKITFVGSLFLTTGITYSNCFDANDTNTWEEDLALLANASLRTGRDAEAIDWAKRALEMNPYRSDMHSVVVQADFNAWALNPEAEPLDTPQISQLSQDATKACLQNEDLLPIVGIYQWKLGQDTEAIKTWQQSADSSPLARLCLYWIGAQRAPSIEEMNLYGSPQGLNLLRTAISVKNAPNDDPIKQTFKKMFQRPSSRTNE